MSTLTISVLGPPRFVRDGVLPGRIPAKSVALVLWLAVTRIPQPRERVLTLLWPASLPPAARKNLRNILWELGETLGAGVLLQDGATLGLDAGVTVDLHALEDGRLDHDSASELEAIAALYRGPLADGLVVHEAPEFEIWLTAERERVAMVFLRLVERIITVHRMAGDWQAIVVHAQRALAVDPLHEALHLTLIEAYIRLGQRAQAAHQYAALTEVLERELGVAPLPETVARYEALVTAAAQVSPMLPPHRRRVAPSLVPFIGRRAELAMLDDEHAQAARGTARVVLLTGDLGMGKTQLWRTWVDTRTRDAVVLETHALETGEPIPFGPLLTLFRQAGPARTILVPPSPLAPLWVAELARLVPELVALWPELPPPLTLAPPAERARLFQALCEVFRLLAQPLLVLIVDDLQWADPSTLDWLVFLVDQLQDAPLLLVGTYRQQDASERLAAVVGTWQRQGRLHLIKVPPLMTEEAHALLEALHAPADRESVARWLHWSGGNPYFLIELSRAPSGEPPGDLAALVRTRVHTTVPAPAYQVVQAAAVLGDSATFALLRATSGRSEEETLDALDTLVTAAVLVAHADTYRFIHPLVAEVIAHDLTPARRAFLHRRSAQALERGSAPRPERLAARLLDHYAAADEPGKAAYYAEHAAAQAQAVGAYAEAAAFARRALHWEPTAQRRLLLGEALMMTADGVTEAHPHVTAALSAFEQAGDATGATRACIALALIGIRMRQWDDARRWLARAPMEQVEGTLPGLAAQVHLMGASVERQRDAYDAAAADLNRADQLIQGNGFPEIGAEVAFERGLLAAGRGDLDAAVVAFAAAVQLGRETSNPLFEATAHNYLAYHTLVQGKVADAQQHNAAALELTERYALDVMPQFAYCTAGEIALAQRELDAAEAAFQRAFAAASAWDNPVHMANVRANQVLVAVARREPDRAHALLREARSLLGDANDTTVRDKIALAGREAAALSKVSNAPRG